MSDIFDHALDAYEDSIAREEDGLDCRYYHRPRIARQPTRCKYCFSKNVRWGKTDGRWVLYSGTSNDKHVCPPDHKDLEEWNISLKGAVHERQRK